MFTNKNLNLAAAVGMTFAPFAANAADLSVKAKRQPAPIVQQEVQYECMDANEAADHLLNLAGKSREGETIGNGLFQGRANTFNALRVKSQSYPGPNGTVCFAVTDVQVGTSIVNPRPSPMEQVALPLTGLFG